MLKIGNTVPLNPFKHKFFSWFLFELFDTYVNQETLIFLFQLFKLIATKSDEKNLKEL